MLIQDSLTGNLHEVPDHLSGYGDYGAGDQVVYDGLGNPVGTLSGIFDDIIKGVGSVVSAIPQAVAAIPRAVASIPQAALSALPGGGPLGLLSQAAAGGPLGLLGRMFGGGAPAAGVPPTPVFARPPAPVWPTPTMGPGGLWRAPQQQYWRSPIPWTRPTPWPAGWVHPQLPYTGLGPRRLYMRCAVWPGPKGLVPSFAALTPAQAQAAAIQQAAQQAAAAVMGGRRRYRRRRRR
jgi:hypothetical protein